MPRSVSSGCASGQRPRAHLPRARPGHPRRRRRGRHPHRGAATSSSRSSAGGPLPEAALRWLDDAFTRLKLDPERGPPADGRRPPTRPSRSTRPACAARGAIDLDDLVARALAGARRRPGAPGALARAAAVLFVDEAQDLDRTQLDLAVLLAGERAGHLPRRRRRPDHLRLAPRGRAARPRPGGTTARPASRGPRDQPPLRAGDRAPSGAARGPQPRALREAHPLPRRPREARSCCFPTAATRSRAPASC